jgi:adenine-specific DNA-methyltransferase
LDAVGGWHLHGTLDVESRVPTCPLGEVADVHSGTTGFDAARIAALLRNGPADDGKSGFPFIVTGNVDRYAVRTGDVRFMKRRWMHPVLPDDPGELTPAKRRLFRGAKILVAGISRRLEAAWDPGGLALGVQLYAVVPRIDPDYLLALLNSKLISNLFRLRFQAKRLAGGYLAVNKSQLAALPIFIPRDQDGQAMQREIAALARELTERMSAVTNCGGSAASANVATMRDIDGQIDKRVYGLYALTEDEIRRVEADDEAQWSKPRRT